MILFTLFPNNIIVGFSEKKDGPMKNSIQNREKFFKKLGIDKKLTIRAGLVHKNKIALVSKKEAGRIIEKTDGLITKEKNIFLTITIADCLPIFIYDPEKEITGLVHGGWRSLAGNILKEAIDKMMDNFKSNPAHILIGIGPGISQCHFEIKNDLVRKWYDRTIFAPGVILKEDNKKYLDLKKIAKIQLMELGIKEQNIEVSPECTFCLKTKYFSYRREKPKQVQTMLAIIGQK
jgi:hypothetical protein